MLNNQKNSRKQGDVGLGAAIAYFTKQGITVAIPLTDNQDYDLIIEKDNKLQKVQVKTSYSKKPNGYYKISLRTCGGNKSRSTVKIFDNTKIDLLFFLTEDNNKYLVPAKNITVINQIILNKTMEMYKLED